MLAASRAWRCLVVIVCDHFLPHFPERLGPIAIPVRRSAFRPAQCSWRAICPNDCSRPAPGAGLVAVGPSGMLQALVSYKRVVSTPLRPVTPTLQICVTCIESNLPCFSLGICYDTGLVPCCYCSNVVKGFVNHHSPTCKCVPQSECGSAAQRLSGALSKNACRSSRPAAPRLAQQ